MNVLPLIADFRIEDTGSYAITSDPSTLVLEPKYNMKWDKSETELKCLTAVKLHNSECMGVEELSSRIESVQGIFLNDHTKRRKCQNQIIKGGEKST